jgi:hypothetical protein
LNGIDLAAVGAIEFFHELNPHGAKRIEHSVKINHPAVTGGAICENKILPLNVTLNHALNLFHGSFQGLRDSEAILKQIHHKVPNDRILQRVFRYALCAMQIY